MVGRESELVWTSLLLLVDPTRSISELAGTVAEIPDAMMRRS